MKAGQNRDVSSHILCNSARISGPLHKGGVIVSAHEIVGTENAVFFAVWCVDGFAEAGLCESDRAVFGKRATTPTGTRRERTGGGVGVGGGSVSGSDGKGTG